MSLSDLKKSHSKLPKKRDFTVDEFISDAENYAKGSATIVSKDTKNLSMGQALLLTKQHLSEKETTHSKPFRRATFTLSEEAIAQLTQLSVGSDLAKSHIIRILINELCSKDQRERLQELLDSQTD